MKKTNKTAKLMQQGGLMIEALAMLGLIAVVTPTMYKKSAERTLEVEDINTATTVRTYMNAAEAYIANNYGDLMTNVFSEPDPNNPNKRIPKANGTVYTVANDALEEYLPYKFSTNRSLYDYNTPQIRIVNNGTNLTAFALFPAKQDAAGGIGQERTSRIASLIGANGGYMPDATTARGVGGLWNLDADAMNSIFAGVDHNTYSLVAASSNVISDVNGGELDNDKYLQRTLEGNPNDPASYANQLWRNTMHTDLYMGNHLPGETQSIASTLEGRNSIRDVRSLIIGAEKAPMKTEGTGTSVVTSESKNNGLYIAGTDGSDYADAYIGGALRATAEQFVVTSRGKFNRTESETAIPQMVFGKNGTEYNFEVDENGDIHDFGHQGELFNKFKNENDNVVDIADNVIEISNPNGILNMHIMDDSTFHVYQNINGEGVATDMQADIMSNGYKGDYNTEDKDSLGNDIGPKYGAGKEPKFPVRVGSNMKVEGIMAAGQVDTQLLRTATLTTGSDKIDDDYKWLDVDKNGIRMRDPAGRTMKDTGENVLTNVGDRTSLVVDKEKIAMRVGASSATHINSSTGFDGHPTQFVMRSTDGTNTISKMSGQAHEIGFNATDMDGAPGYVQTRNSKVQIMVGSEGVTTGEGDEATTSYTGEIKFSGFNSSGSSSINANYRVRQSGGHMDLERANLRVIDENNNQVFSVRGNKLKENNKYDNSYTNGKEGTSIDYHIAAHGNTLFTSNSGEKVGTEARGEIKYLSVGKYNSDAGVSIMANGKKSSEAVKNVLVIDQTEDISSTALPDASITLKQYTSEGTSSTTISKSPNKGEPGTVYIRKGMVDIVSEGNKEANKEYLAHEGSGVVRAARFVANNVDSNGAAYSVPTKLTATEFNLYNDSSHRTRYDTYMVNPAYTSVMNDIKLVSRGGARLSDVLPDFINKGIYVANNTNTNFPTFSGWSSITYSTAADKAEVTPYLGGVPAPQCPPGYGRVITVAPVGFKMAQAGGIEHNGSKFKVREDQMGPANAFKSKSSYEAAVKKFEYDSNGKREADNYVPAYNKLRSGLEGQGTLHMDATLPDMAWSENSTGASGTIKGVHVNTDFSVTSMSNNFPIKMCDQTQSTTDGTGCTLLDTYVLSSNNKDSFKPVLFQQSTYLKTLVVPLCSGSSSDYGQTCKGEGNYTQGWAVLMGFIYPKSQYQGVIDSIGAKALASDSGTSETWYWNLFPVLKGSLEAYATVYCFYDRTNIYGGYNSADGYNYMNAATSFKPNDTSRREKLNDPTLKYNELW